MQLPAEIIFSTCTQCKLSAETIPGVTSDVTTGNKLFPVLTPDANTQMLDFDLEISDENRQNRQRMSI